MTNYLYFYKSNYNYFRLFNGFFIKFFIKLFIGLFNLFL